MVINLLMVGPYREAVLMLKPTYEKKVKSGKRVQVKVLLGFYGMKLARRRGLGRAPYFSMARAWGPGKLCGIFKNSGQ